MSKPKRPISLTLRVLLFVMLATGFSLALSGRLILSAIQHHFMEQDSDELEVIQSSIQSTLERATQANEALGEALKQAVVGHHGVYFQVSDASGRLIYRSAGTHFWKELEIPTAIDKKHTHIVETWESNAKSYRGIATTVTLGSTVFPTLIALDMEFHKRFLTTFRRSLFLIMLATGAVTLVAAWFGIYQGHLPLRSLSKSIQQVQTDKLDIRLEPASVPFELKELVLSFNHMIARLEEGFVRLSHFSSDLAHELRTPLTNIITHTQVVLNKPRTTEEYRELLYSSLEEQERLAKMVGDMLWLAKSDNDLIKLEMVPLNLVEEVQELFDFFDALAAEKQLTLSLRGSAPLLNADRALIRRALSNLLSNAIRHTPRGGNVRIALADTPEAITVCIANPGAPIPENHLQKIFDRFYRVDPSRQRNNEGAGLGLAIVKSIISAHRGKITVESNVERTEFKIYFYQRSNNHPMALTTLC
ncbi:two-component system heavy metal sensor histidine kinase CusS [Alteromonadaceae bacterium 2753L.S.0a.02]|nr:two-component system heavy metal sensor histidine kinase CusS [Alteromonadaceae bacterium 2753L.S.0a.02]